MSEYQFYEFRSIDKPLSKEDKSEIGTWSKRTNPSNTSAIFTYSYGDFPKDEIMVVEKYFDAMFYISNWGTTRLMFKFPKDLFDLERINQYCIEDGLTIIEKPNCFILDMVFSDSEKEKIPESKRRSIAVLAKRVEELKQERKSKEKKESDEIQLKKLKYTELHENEHWNKVDQLIADKNGKAYDEAISLMKDLKELAIHKNNFDDFCIKVELIRHKNSRLSSFTSRISSAKLTEN